MTSAAPDRLKVALVARPPRLALLAAAATACPLIEIAAQSGMSQDAALPDVPWHDDTRVMCGLAGIQAVLLGLSTRGDVAVGDLALERGLHVWRWPPAARTFAETAELAARIRAAQTVYRVASWWEHVAGAAWNELPWPAALPPRYSELRCAMPGPWLDSWLSDAEECAGGALAYDAYPLIEALVAARGLPGRVGAALARIGRTAPREGVAADERAAGRGLTRQTEDVSVAILGYEGAGIASIRALWDGAVRERTLWHHYEQYSVELTHETAALWLSADRCEQRPVTADWLGAELIAFVDFVRGGARDRASAALDRHLAAAALLEAIYLAARTGHPESPRKFYELQGLAEPQL